MGQEKDVHVYYFVAGKTVEVNILEERTGRVLVERGGECLLVSDIQDGDRKDFGGLPFLGAACGAGLDVEEDDDEDGE
jgi:hypothetical protein